MSKNLYRGRSLRITMAAICAAILIFSAEGCHCSSDNDDEDDEILIDMDGVVDEIEDELTGREFCEIIAHSFGACGGYEVLGLPDGDIERANFVDCCFGQLWENPLATFLIIEVSECVVEYRDCENRRSECYRIIDTQWDRNPQGRSDFANCLIFG